MLLKPDRSYFIPDMIKEVEAHEDKICWALMKKSEVKKHENKYGKIKTIYLFGISSARYYQMEYK